MHYGEKLIIRNAVWSETENKKDPKFRGGRGCDKMHDEILPKKYCMTVWQSLRIQKAGQRLRREKAARLEAEDRKAYITRGLQ